MLQNPNNNMRYNIISYMMVITIIYSMFISGILWWFNTTINPYIFPAAILISISHFLKQKISIYEIVLFLLLIVISIIINCFIPDMSWDGQAYHQPMVYALANGWNPIIDSHNPVINKIWDMNLWIDHYPKGMEISAASIFSMTGNLESGKAVNTILMCASLMITIDFLKRHFPHMARYKRFLYTFLISFPTIFITLGFTFYVDSATYYLVYWILLLQISNYSQKGKKFSLYLLFIIVSLAACTKMNTLFWILYFIAFYCVVLLYKKKTNDLFKIIFTSSFAILFSISTVVYNPIISNIIDHKNPIYPLGTTEAMDISNNATPNILKNKDRISQVLISFISRPNDNNETPILNPYIISYKYNIRSLGSAAKLGGAGIFFMELFLISVFLLLLTPPKKHKIYIYSISFLFIISPFVLPFGSSYRYIPFISLLPTILLLYTEYNIPTSRFAYALKLLCLALFTLNNLISIPFVIKNKYCAYKKQKEAIAYIQNNRPNIVYRSKNWSFNYKLCRNLIVDDTIFSTPTDKYAILPEQIGPPIYMDKDFYSKLNK